jgi:hypothetical protein
MKFVNETQAMILIPIFILVVGAIAVCLLSYLARSF